MVRFFGSNDRYTLDEAIDYLRFEMSKQFNYSGVLNHSGALKRKSDRERAEYAGCVLNDIIKEFERVRDNGPTPEFIMEHVREMHARRTLRSITARPTVDVDDDVTRVEGEAPEDDMEFVNWLAAKQTERSILIHEVMPGEFAVAQYVMDPGLLRRVVLASPCDVVIVRTKREGNGQAVSSFFDRNNWLRRTDSLEIKKRQSGFESSYDHTLVTVGVL